MSRKFKFRNPEVMSLSKCALFLFFTFNFSLFTFHLGAQGVTKYGESKSTSTDFVDKNGKIGSSPALSKYGQVLVLATLTTTTVSSIASTTATSGGTVTSDGGTTITVRGVCWSTTTGPTTALTTKTTNGTGTGIFDSSITGLTAGTVYYVRAYAINSAGTDYGSELSFTTLAVPGAPIIGTATAGNAQATVTFTEPAFNGGSTITSYTATSTPGSFTGTLTQAGSGTITVTGLTNGTAYTFTVKATNAIGTSEASSASNSVIPSVPLSIGDAYQGGKIAYIFSNTDPGYVSGETHGLIAATADQNAGIIWAVIAYQYTSVPGGTATTLGSGLANTDKIITQNGAGTTYAAGKARAYSGGRYSDWYLPSKDELDKLYLNRGAVGGFASASYWSSTEKSNHIPWSRDFVSGTQNDYDKYDYCCVRAIRAF